MLEPADQYPQRLHALSIVCSIAPAILPTSSPSLFPFIAIKAVLAQLHIDCVMCLTHPSPKLLTIADSWAIAILHPSPKVIRTYPAWVHLAEEPNELLRL